MREPLLHFLVAGLLLFAVYRILHPELSRTAEVSRIEVTADDLRQLEVAWTAQWHRPPTPEEMHRLVEGRVREEILYREALAFGLDRGDIIVKRRLAQKMEFLAGDVSALPDPAVDELRAWYARNSERFAEPGRTSFRHVYFSTDRRGDQARADAMRVVTKLADKPVDSPVVSTIGDQFMFQDHYGDRSPEQIASIFGSAFAAAIDQVRPGSWQGPLESGLGWHLVFVTSATPGRVPSYDEIEPEIKRGWIDEQRAVAQQRAFEAMKAHYEIRLPEARVATVAHQPAAKSVAVNVAARVVRWFGRMLAVAAVVVIAHYPSASAHETRPAYLELTETLPDRYDVVWRTPVLAGQRLPVVLGFPDGANNLGEPRLHELPDSMVERRVITLPGGLGSKRIEFVGLQGTITDVLVRIQTRDGGHSTTLVHPSQPWVEIAAARGSFVAGAYLVHGVDHILVGYDHLLFVFALILIVKNLRMLVATVTAFTVAHSITLALATLGVVHVPGPPVEATIALSILLLACEIARSSAGQPSLTTRWPWLVAFSFGLLHGFGFAGALSEIGLPRGDIPLALFTFNVGVEIGQLTFIAAVLTTLAIVRRIPLPAWAARQAQPVATYAIGTLAAFWFIERVAAFLA